MIANETTSTEWATRRLGDITRVRTGKLDANAQRPGGPYPFFTCGEEILAIDHYAFDTEAVLLAGNGNFNVKWYHGKFNAYQRTYVIEPEGVHGKWLFYAVQSTLRKITSGNRGSIIRFIRLGDIVESTVCVPPFDEQRRIVAEIEKQFTRLEAGVAALRRVQANLKRYRAAILKTACEGRLVPTEADLARQEGRAYETGNQILARITTERRRKWQGRGKDKEPIAPDTNNLPPLPEGWTWAMVEQLAAIEPNAITDGPFGSNLKTEHYTLCGPRVIRLQNIGEGFFTDEKAHISDSHFARLQKHRVFANDIVIAGLGENPPRACLIPPSLGPAIVKADCIRFKPHEEIAPKYINISINSDPVRRRVKNIVHGVGRPRLNLREIKAIFLPIPPLAEQKRIVAEVERRLSVLDEQETAVAASLRRATRLRQSILQRAFSGRLIS